MIKKYSVSDLSLMIDHTLLDPNPSQDVLDRLCADAVKYQFRMVAVNPCQTAYCKNLLKHTNVNVGAVVSLPLGKTSLRAKLDEGADAIENGADEIEYVINIPELVAGDCHYIQKEMEPIVDMCRDAGVVSKVIIETCYLTQEQIASVAKIAKEVGPDFISTSVGFGRSVAKAEDVTLIKQIVGNSVKIKVAGKINDYETLYSMINAGAERIGTSDGINILEVF